MKKQRPAGGVHLSARIEQDLRDFDRIGRTPLFFGAVGADEVQERGAMTAQGARPNQLWILLQKAGFRVGLLR